MNYLKDLNKKHVNGKKQYERRWNFVSKTMGVLDELENSIKTSHWFGYHNSDEIGDAKYNNPKVYIDNDDKIKGLQFILDWAKKVVSSIEGQIARSEDLKVRASKGMTKEKYKTLKFFEENSQ